MYFITSGFNAKTAIYTDSGGAPDSLIAQSTSEWIHASGWHTFPVPEKMLSTGYYWLSVVSDRAKAFVAVTRESAQHLMRSAYYMGEFRSSFGTSNWAVSGSTSIYATYIPAPPPSSFPAPSPSFETYWDQACINQTSSITWGDLSPGATNIMVVYVRNEGNMPITLYRATTNWNPINAANFINIDWGDEMLKEWKCVMVEVAVAKFYGDE